MKRILPLLLGTVAWPAQAEHLAQPPDWTAEEITVTATREAQKLSETPATINAVHEDEIETTRPAHPSEILRKMPGVFASVV